MYNMDDDPHIRELSSQHFRHSLMQQEEEKVVLRISDTMGARFTLKAS
jgi:hypothetical protein